MLPCRTWMMAAIMTLADPSIAFATSLDGLLSWLAIWAADSPAITWVVQPGDYLGCIAHRP